MCIFVPFLGLVCKDLCCQVTIYLPQKQKQGLRINVIEASVVSVAFVFQVVELDLSTVVPCCSGPKRPQDKVPVSGMKKDFEDCLKAKVCFSFLAVTSLERNNWLTQVQS